MSGRSIGIWFITSHCIATQHTPIISNNCWSQLWPCIVVSTRISSYMFLGHLLYLLSSFTLICLEHLIKHLISDIILILLIQVIINKLLMNLLLINLLFILKWRKTLLELTLDCNNLVFLMQSIWISMSWYLTLSWQPLLFEVQISVIFII